MQSTRINMLTICSFLHSNAWVLYADGTTLRTALLLFSAEALFSAQNASNVVQRPGSAGTPGHRRRSGWTSWGRMASAEGGSVPSGVRYGEGCPLHSRLEGLGERRELPYMVWGQAPAKNGFWRIFKATERSFLYLHDKI